MANISLEQNTAAGFWLLFRAELSGGGNGGLRNIKGSNGPKPVSARSPCGEQSYLRDEFDLVSLRRHVLSRAGSRSGAKRAVAAGRRSPTARRSDANTSSRRSPRFFSPVEVFSLLEREALSSCHRAAYLGHRQWVYSQKGFLTRCC